MSRRKFLTAQWRNLILANPVPGNAYATVRTLVAAYQMVKPREIVVAAYKARIPQEGHVERGGLCSGSARLCSWGSDQAPLDIDAVSPHHNVRGAMLGDPCRLQMQPRGIEGLPDRVAGAEGVIERRRELGGRLAANGSLHSDDAIDVLGDGLRLREGMTGTQDYQANAGPAQPKELAEGALADRTGAAIVAFEHQLVLGVAMAAEVDDVRLDLEQGLLQIAWSHCRALDDLDGAPMRCRCEPVADLLHLTARVQRGRRVRICRQEQDPGPGSVGGRSG